jgi:hypothetical protein
MDPLEEHRSTFTPEELSFLEHVLEEACRQLQLHDLSSLSKDPRLLRSRLAKEVIAIAAQGEMDPVMITSTALKRLIAERINSKMQALCTRG